VLDTLGHFITSGGDTADKKHAAAIAVNYIPSASRSDRYTHARRGRDLQAASPPALLSSDDWE
jgi:hypothetical protein